MKIWRIALYWAIFSATQVAWADSARLFRDVVAPALEGACVKCHHEGKARGGLALTSADALQKGSENGPVVQPGKPDESRLLEVLLGNKPEMPQNAPPLDQKTVAAIGEWIKTGAAWPAGMQLTDRSAPSEARPLWSLQPIQRVAIPTLNEHQNKWARNAIDAFIAADHARNGFVPAPEADRRTLVRRLYFDITGLPPTPEDIQKFLADQSPNAYEKLVDRLLASPAYGERWARHWLDIVHYGETHGYDKDKPRPNAWPYRDYVIGSLNQDKPYARFVQEQIAGDALFPDSPDAVKALGFLAAGPWDFIGHAEVPETKTDGKIARHLDRDDMVGTAFGSLMSLTIQCAQCHDHKFDPLTHADYYRLQAVFAGVDRADKPFFDSPRKQLQYQKLEHRRLELLRMLPELEREVRATAGVKLEEMESKIRAAKDALNPKEDPRYGYHSQISATQDAEKWVVLQFKEPVRLSKIILSPASDNFNNIGPGFGFPLRYKIEYWPQFNSRRQEPQVIDFSAADQPNPGIKPQVIPITSREPIRSVRIRATKLAPRQNDYIFALAEISVLDESGRNMAPSASVSALDSIEAPVRWQLKNLTDGVAPVSPVEAADREGLLASLEKSKEQLLAEKVPAELLLKYKQAKSRLERVGAELKSMSGSSMVFAGTVHQGGGAFTGTGATGGTPRSIYRLPRGDVKNPKEAFGPGAIQVLKFAPFEFQLADSADESLRRRELAGWITHQDNPLFWRSIVNRVWQYHFGRGIVDPPGDFGQMGGTPSHPELLDYLALHFRDTGGRLKQLHRYILTSAAYRQQSTGPAEFATKDGNNIHLWRQNRRRLEAEAVRDSLLAVAGRLDRRMGGPSFQDFVVQHPEHSPHYEYQLANPDDPATHRRSIYRFVVRSQPQPFLTAMDCADPSIRVDKRNESISAAAALAQWNHGLVLAVAGHLGQKMQLVPGTLADQLQWAFAQCLGRPPKPDELQLLVHYAGKHGLDKTARLLLNLNEFSFVD